MHDEPKPAKRQAQSERPALYVDSTLDDYGLTMAQFRLMGRIARRAGPQGCYESIESMAKGCRCHPDTARAAIGYLVHQNIIRVEVRDGRTNIYTVNPMSLWTHPPETDGGVAGDTPPKPMEGLSTTPPKRRDDTPPKPMEAHPPERKGDEGNPSEGNPSKALRVPASVAKAASRMPQPRFQSEIALKKERNRNDLVCDARDIFGSEWQKESKRMCYLIQQRPEKFESVLADLRIAIVEGRVRTTKAKYFEDTWKRFP